MPIDKLVNPHYYFNCPVGELFLKLYERTMPSSRGVSPDRWAAGSEIMINSSPV
jgi:hypothetical protein